MIEKKYLIIFGILISLSFLNDSYAFDESLIDLSWTNHGSNVLLFDSNNDGAIDNVYSYLQVNGIGLNMTKIFGNGVSVIDINLNATVTKSIQIYGDEIWYGGGSDSSGVKCRGVISKANILTGVVSNYIYSDSDPQKVGIHNCLFHFIKSVWNTPTGYHQKAYPDGPNPSYSVLIKNTTNTLYYNEWISTTGICSSTQNSHAFLLLIQNITSGTCASRVEVMYDSYNISKLSSLDWRNSPSYLSGICDGTTCYYANSNYNADANISTTLTSSTIKKSVTLDYYGNGMIFEGMNNYTSNDIPIRKTYFKDYLPNDPLSNKDNILLTHYKILNSSLTTKVPFFYYNDGTNEKILYEITNTLFSSPFPDYSLRSTEYILLDDYTGADYSTLLSSSSLQTYTPFLITPLTNYPTLSTTGGFVLPSGYNIKVDLSTTNRQLISKYTDFNEIKPSFLGLSSGLTSLSILVQNAPNDYALIIKDSQSFENKLITWSIQKLNADKTITVDLPSGLCVTIIGITQDTYEQNNFGELCASGTMPKTLVYSENLSFVFWSLPYGVAHTFNSDSDILTTKVRHDTTPYNYTIRIFDANNVLQYEQEFLSTNSTIQTETHNATGITFPALLRVYDDDGNQIYYSTIGIPGYLSASVAWFSQWLTISGFNLLFMLPLVFGAMFTRNTVGIGTMISVVFIATLTWLGVLPIPDVAIWFMFIIAAIGIVAYKKLYD